MSGISVAVVGATGAVGRMILDILHERNFPVSDMHALASANSRGMSVAWQEGDVQVQVLDDFDFASAELVFFAAGGGVAEQYAPSAVAAGCTVIDNSSRFRYEEDVPLIVPEVNAHALGAEKLIANPNCSTAQMVVALKPLHERYGIVHVEVATYQSVSGAGQKGVAALEEQTIALMQGHECPHSEVFDGQIAFNVLAGIGPFQPNGYSGEEWKMVQETQKILGEPGITVNPTCARVPVFYAHSEAVSIHTREQVDIAEARSVLESAPGVAVLDNPDERLYATALDGSGGDEVYVSRLRPLLYTDMGMNLWVVSDNLRKGAALNAVQIAELVYGRNYLEGGGDS